MPDTQANFIRSHSVLETVARQQTQALEFAHGNGDLLRALDILGIAGPFTVLSPWELEDESGRHLIHAGGYAAIPFGEMYPPLIEFMQSFLASNRSMGFAQQSLSEWRAALEANLVRILASQAPSHADSQVFFSNSGAEAIEAAIKFVKASRPKGKHIINFTRAYHGKTTGALSLTPNAEYQDVFKPLMPGVTTVPYGDVRALEQTLYTLGPQNVTAIIVEPVQGEGGVITPPAGFLAFIQQVAEKYGILTIADEIQTGLGRSGHWFASLADGLEADVITLAKPLGGGMVPVGATIARKHLVQKTLGGLEGKRHSSTFGGGSLAMAVGLKSLELIMDEGLVEKAKEDGHYGLRRLKDLQQTYPHIIEEVRGAGMLFAIKLKPVMNPRLAAGQQELLRQLGSGLALRALHLNGVHACYTLNSSQVIRLTPPLTIPRALLDTLFDRVEATVRGTPKSWQMVAKSPGRLVRLAKLAFK